jgi:hypothetical protein
MIEYTVKVYSNRTEWYLNRHLHRVDGPAIEFAGGDKYWYFYGERHRADGPAIELANGSKLWYLNGNYHRVDGPAYELANGEKSWYLNGEKLSEEEFNQRTKDVKRPTCEGRTVVIDGVIYKLTRVDS